MDRHELIRRLMKTFLGELEEHVRALDRDLLALERGPDEATRAHSLQALLRTAHSLKGAARSVDIAAIEATAHRLESIFADARDGALSLGPELFEILFATVDATKDAAARLTAGEDLGESLLTDLLPRLAAASASRIREPHHAEAVSEAENIEKLVQPGATAATRAIAAGPTGNGFVRISAARLDRLLALGGELLVARRRAESRGSDVGHLLELAKRLETGWRAAEMAIRKAHRGNGTEDIGSSPATETVHLPIRLVERTTEKLRQLTHQIENLTSGLASDRKALDVVASPLEVEVLLARMVPFAAACEGFERAVRDLAQGAGKEVELSIQGGEIEIDRSIVEGIKAPLMHLVRNAVDHGIEAPAARVAAGKAARGRITMIAALRSGRVEIVVADDGRGLDISAIREQARQRQLPLPKGDQEIARLIFASGFSTAPTVTDISGRGIGLDVVRTAVESRRGNVDVAFEPGLGTRIVLTLPISLTRIPALLVTAGGQTYAFDSAAVRGLARVEMDELHMMEGRNVLAFDGGPVPVFPLTAILGQRAHEPLRAGKKAPVVILGTGADRAAFTVDDLLAEQDVVVKDLGPRLPRVRNVTGATVLATGRIALILNAAELVDDALAQAPGRTSVVAREPVKAVKRLLVVDDSVTTRTLMKSILEAAGYEVMAAVDGTEAWQILQEKGADLVVSDIEMPRMDGFALTEAIRSSKRLRNLPVVLVTALESETDRLRGLEAGADAYLVKSAFDQTNLIQTIGQIL